MICSGPPKHVYLSMLRPGLLAERTLSAIHKTLCDVLKTTAHIWDAGILPGRTLVVEPPRAEVRRCSSPTDTHLSQPHRLFWLRSHRFVIPCQNLGRQDLRKMRMRATDIVGASDTPGRSYSITHLYINTTRHIACWYGNSGKSKSKNVKSKKASFKLNP